MNTETIATEQSSSFLHGRLRQLSWITAIIMSSIFWVGLFILIF